LLHPLWWLHRLQRHSLLPCPKPAKMAKAKKVSQKTSKKSKKAKHKKASAQ
jgi:hypothetical protein